jgi:hypothetical protein
MKPFDVFFWQPPGWHEPHPCVVISHPSRAANKDPVEVLMCSSQRATRPPQAHEVILDAADSMDWPTICKCDLVHAVPKGELKRQRGTVSHSRRAVLIRTLIAAHGWPEILAPSQ